MKSYFDTSYLVALYVPNLWHVAAALKIGAETFVTFDKDQFNLARAEGLRAVMPP